MPVRNASRPTTGSPLAIFARRYDASGAPVGDKFIVRDDPAIEFSSPAIAGLADGSFQLSAVYSRA